MAVVLWGAPITDTPTWSVALSGLGNAGFSLSTVIDNTTGLYENALFNLVGTVASPSLPATGFIGIYTLYAADGTNYPTPPGASAGNTGIPMIATIPALGGATFTAGHTFPFVILPMKFKLLLYNGLGTSLPSGTVTATLNRWAETVA